MKGVPGRMGFCEGLPLDCFCTGVVRILASSETPFAKERETIATGEASFPYFGLLLARKPPGELDFQEMRLPSRRWASESACATVLALAPSYGGVRQWDLTAVMDTVTMIVSREH